MGRLDLHGPPVSLGAIEAALTMARGLAPELALALVSSITIGWLTDRQMQEHVVRPCVFGGGCCGERDELEHHVRCDVLWGELARAAPPGVAPGPDRCGVGVPVLTVDEREGLIRRVAAAHHAYRQ